MTKSLFAGFEGCRYATPSLILFTSAVFASIPLVSQSVYTRELMTGMAKKNLTITANDRLIPCTNDSESPAADVQIQAQKSAMLILMGNTLSGAIPAMFTILFWGPLSDRWGRKPILLIAYAGGSVQLLLDFLTIYYQWPPEMFFVAKFVGGMSGGTMAILCACSSYVTDVTTPESRSMRIYIMEGCFMAFMGLTMLAVGLWSKASKSFHEPLLGSFACLILGFVYTLFILPESRKKRNDDEIHLVTSDVIGCSINSEKEAEGSKETTTSTTTRKKNEKESISSYLSGILAETISAFRHEGDGKWNFHLILPAIVFFFAFCANVGGSTVQSLFEENFPFCWDSDLSGKVATVKLFGVLFVSISALVVFRKFGIGDYVIVAICTCLSFASRVIFAFSFKTWHLYIGMAVGGLGLTFPLLRSGMSKECAKDKIGALFAGVAFVESASNLLGSMAMSPLYWFTVSFFPGFSFLFMALLEVVALCLLIPLIRRKGKKKDTEISTFEPLK